MKDSCRPCYLIPFGESVHSIGRIRWNTVAECTLRSIGIIFGMLFSAGYLPEMQASALLANAPASWNVEASKAVLKEEFGAWEIQAVGAGGRIDALRDLDSGAVICATRKPDPGRIFLSTDYGIHRSEIASSTRNAITCLAARSLWAFYLLTDHAEVFGTSDGGASWRQLRPTSPNRNRVGGAAAYGLMVTSLGTLLVSDTDSDGGHLFRSADDGATWAEVPIAASDALYRFIPAGDGFVVNVFEGAMFKSGDDGLTWSAARTLSKRALFATEQLGGSYLLAADHCCNDFPAAVQQRPCQPSPYRDREHLGLRQLEGRLGEGGCGDCHCPPGYRGTGTVSRFVRGAGPARTVQYPREPDSPRDRRYPSGDTDTNCSNAGLSHRQENGEAWPLTIHHAA